MRNNQSMTNSRTRGNSLFYLFIFSYCGWGKGFITFTFWSLKVFISSNGWVHYSRHWSHLDIYQNVTRWSNISLHTMETVPVTHLFNSGYFDFLMIILIGFINSSSKIFMRVHFILLIYHLVKRIPRFYKNIRYACVSVRHKMKLLTAIQLERNQTRKSSLHFIICHIYDLSV